MEREKSRKNISIFVRTSFECLHYWPDAPGAVAFLRHPHRHKFHVEARLRARDTNREYEFFLVKRDLDRYLKKYSIEQVTMKSCEAFCSELFDQMKALYPSLYRVEVNEDQENGAVIEEVTSGTYQSKAA